MFILGIAFAGKTGGATGALGIAFAATAELPEELDIPGVARGAQDVAPACLPLEFQNPTPGNRPSHSPHSGFMQTFFLM